MRLFEKVCEGEEHPCLRPTNVGYFVLGVRKNLVIEVTLFIPHSRHGPPENSLSQIYVVLIEIFKGEQSSCPALNSELETWNTERGFFLYFRENLNNSFSGFAVPQFWDPTFRVAPSTDKKWIKEPTKPGIFE